MLSLRTDLSGLGLIGDMDDSESARDTPGGCWERGGDVIEDVREKAERIPAPR